MEVGLRILLESTATLPSVLHLSLNIDGIPLYKSSNQSFWPILAQVKECIDKEPFVIGLFCGESKPMPLDDFLNDFVNEMETLQHDGIEHHGKIYQIKIQCDMRLSC